MPDSDAPGRYSPRYFDDLAIGQEFITSGRTVTETDIQMFAMLTGDWSRIHTDEEFARQSIFGKRVAHGPLGLIISVGLMVRMGVFEGTALAGLEYSDWVFKAPICIGDTVHCRMTITETRLTSDGKRGVIQRQMELINQRGEVVQVGKARNLMARRIS
jgi:acyl dehydratase